jgi:hypothetical protein
MTQWGLDTLFNPAKRHMDEEKQRLQSTREEVGDSSGGKRIDLSSGKVTIQRKPAPAGDGREDGPEDAAELLDGAAAAAQDAEPEDAEPEDAEPEDAEPEGAEPHDAGAQDGGAHDTEARASEAQDGRA